MNAPSAATAPAPTKVSACRRETVGASLSVVVATFGCPPPGEHEEHGQEDAEEQVIAEDGDDGQRAPGGE